MTILSLFTHPQVVTNLVSSFERRRYFEECQ